MVASDLAKERTRCGSWQYWAIVLSVVPVVLVITLAVCLHGHPLHPIVPTLLFLQYNTPVAFEGGRSLSPCGALVRICPPCSG